VTGEPEIKQKIVSQMVDLGGTTLHLRVFGNGRTPLILLHGLGGDSTSWTLNHRQIAAGRRVISVDLPGHGKSDREVGEGTVPSTAELLSQLPDALGIERFHLLGLSYGGALAMDLAGRIPDRIRSLTCVSSTGLGHEVNLDFILGYLDAETPEAMRPQLEKLYHDTRKINDAMVGYALFGRADSDYRACVRRITDANFLNGGQRYNYREALAAFPFPVNVIWGREDRIVPVAHAESLPDHIPVHILDDVGHMPNAEAADRFNELVNGLIGEIDDEK
jgi:pyruvate dehydrogenase E2 component (dihydrolipoamide acetyltransferase)